MRWLLCLLLCVGACADLDNGETHVRWLDYPDFVRDVQPILGARCGNPSCHGRPERPFSIYSQGQWRDDASHTHVDVPLSEYELVHNYNASCVFVTDAALPEDAALLLKPLAATAGVAHGGGIIFDGITDRDYQALLRWLERGWEQ